jgi:hypothetical protein
METSQHEVTLENGYTDAKGITHKTLTFGHRLTGQDLFNIDRSTSGIGVEASKCWLFDTSLNSFGDLPKLAMLNALLSLDSLELEEVESGYDEFLRQTKAPSEFLAEDAVSLSFGIKHEGETYKIVTFGNPLRGYDFIRADNMNLTGVARLCYLIGLRIKSIATPDGSKSIDGAAKLEAFNEMDADDIFTLQGAAETWEAARRRDHALRRTRSAKDETADTEAVN